MWLDPAVLPFHPDPWRRRAYHPAAWTHRSTGTSTSSRRSPTCSGDGCAATILMSRWRAEAAAVRRDPRPRRPPALRKSAEAAPHLPHRAVAGARGRHPAGVPARASVQPAAGAAPVPGRAGPHRRDRRDLYPLAGEHGRAADSVEVLAGVAASLGIDDPAAAIARDEVKRELLANGEQAGARGVRRVPTLACATNCSGATTPPNWRWPTQARSRRARRRNAPRRRIAEGIRRKRPHDRPAAAVEEEARAGDRPRHLRRLPCLRDQLQGMERRRHRRAADRRTPLRQGSAGRGSTACTATN